MPEFWAGVSNFSNDEDIPAKSYQPFTKGAQHMLDRIKHYVLIAAAIGAFYFLLSHHFIITSWRDFDVLKKNELTLAHTFYSIRQSPPEETLKIEALRNAGIGDWMVEHGMLTEEKLSNILWKIELEQ